MSHNMSQSNLDYGVKKALEAVRATPVEKVEYTLRLEEKLLKDVLLDFLLRAKGITLDGSLSHRVAITSNSTSTGTEYSATISVERPGALPEQPDDAILGPFLPIYEALVYLASPDLGHLRLSNAIAVLLSSLSQEGFAEHAQKIQGMLSALTAPESVAGTEELLTKSHNNKRSTELRRIAEIYGKAHLASQAIPARDPSQKALQEIRSLSYDFLIGAGAQPEHLQPYLLESRDD